MFKTVRILLYRLKKGDNQLCLLPDGLYSLKNRFIKDSDLIKDYLKKYSIGTRLKVIKEQIDLFRPDLDKIFLELKPYKSSSFKSIHYHRLTYDLILNEIREFKFKKNKDPYENFLEANIIYMVICSLQYGKTVLGGVWSSGFISNRIRSVRKTSYKYFASNVQSKNELILKLREMIHDYPKVYFQSNDMVKGSAFTEYHSQYATELEYRVLQVKCKLLLQELALHSYYLTDKEKADYDKRFNYLKEMMNSYPVILDEDIKK
ncbi:MAG: hypothetical protein KKH98_00575 [Spirochaetes bacterium]|nr:hypothetical protein [Spirochaetota bacterium]